MKPKRDYKAELKQWLACDIGAYFRAFHAVKKLDTKRFMASGVIIEITDLKGRTLMEPVMIQDGLSDVTIQAIQSDIKKSYDFRLSFNKLP